MKKLFIALATATSGILLSITPALAFTLDTIGSSTVTTQSFSEWWYTAENPLLSGTAAASSTVSVTVDGTAYSSTADASGNWSYAPTTLTTGDRSVSITGDGTTVAFTLHVGQSVPTSTTTTTASSSGTLPVSGSLTQTLLMLGFGAGIILAGYAIKPKTS